MKKILSAIFAALMMAMSGCGAGDAEPLIRQAESDIEDGNIDRARELCASLADTTAFVLTPRQQCRVAMVYVQISEASDDQSDVASAADIFFRAAQQAPDSVALFIDDLTGDDLGRAALVRHLAGMIGENDSIPDDTFPDDIVDGDDSHE